MMSKYCLKGVSCVIGAFLIQFALGTLYTFGNMSPYIASYLRFKTENTWVTMGHTVWILAMTFFLMGSLMAIGGLIEKKIGSRITCLIGGLSMSLSVALTYFTVQMNLMLVILSYGVGFGFGNGISYSVSLTAAMRWFPRQKGMISGIVVGGFGLGSFLFNLIQTKIINPSNITPRVTNGSFNFSVDIPSSLNSSNISIPLEYRSSLSEEKYFFEESILNRVPICFVILGVTYAAIQVVGLVMLTDHGAYHMENDTELNNMDGDGQEKESLKGSDIKVERLPSLDTSKKFQTIVTDYTVAKGIKHRMFWLLWATFFFNGLGIVTISSVYKSFGQQFIGDDQYFAILGSVGGICNCVGRVIWGHLNDKFSYRIVMSALTVLMTVTMGTFYFCSFIPNLAATKAIYFVYVCVLFIALSGSFSMLPCATAQCFGNKNLATIYGLIYTGLAIASVTGAIISSFCFEVIQYRGQFAIATIAALISLLLTQMYQPPGSLKKSKKVIL